MHYPNVMDVDIIALMGDAEILEQYDWREKIYAQWNARVVRGPATITIGTLSRETRVLLGIEQAPDR